MNQLVAAPVVLPLLGAALSLFFARTPRVQRTIAISVLAACLAIAIVLLVAVDNGPIVLNLGGWAPPLGIVLVVDRLSALLLSVSIAVTLAVLIYSGAQGVAETGRENAPVSVFHPTFLVLSAGVSDAFLAGDLFNLYVGFEILLFASFVLITLGGTRDRMRAGTTYVVVSLLSSMIFLIAIAMIYAATGTVNMAHLAVRLGEIDPGTAFILHIMLLVGFGIKAAVFPLSAWLPDSYPTAPAPVTAVFAGLLTKVGVYAIIRTEITLFPGNDLDLVLGVVAAVTMFVGILGAVAQDDIKRMLSFTLVSHIGYMVWGVALANMTGLSATLFYVVHHITVQTSLFLVAGLMEYHSGSTSATRLGSLLKLAPVIAILYFIPAMNLSGIPPFSGFLGKAGLVQSSVEAASVIGWVLLGVGLVSSLLTLYVMTKTWNMTFWQAAEEEVEPRKLPPLMLGATGALIGLSLFFTFAAGPVMQYTDRAAVDLMGRNPYIEAVLPDGEYPEVVYHDPWAGDDQ